MILAPKIDCSPHNKTTTLFALCCEGTRFAYRWALEINKIEIKRHAERRLEC